MAILESISTFFGEKLYQIGLKSLGQRIRIDVLPITSEVVYKTVNDQAIIHKFEIHIPFLNASTKPETLYGFKVNFYDGENWWNIPLANSHTSLIKTIQPDTQAFIELYSQKLSPAALPLPLLNLCDNTAHLKIEYIVRKKSFFILIDGLEIKLQEQPFNPLQGLGLNIP